MESAIHFILTGGTIDSYFEPSVATTIPSNHSVIPTYLEDGIKPYAHLSYKTICMKDSRDLTDADRNSIFTAVKQSPSDKIIITHGTDAMVQTVEFLTERSADHLGKTIVLTGSFIPLQHFALSDAGFNLGFAMNAVNHLDAGIYICMNAEIFEAGRVAKDKPNARFVRK